MELNKLKFPIGEFVAPKEYSIDLISTWKETIAMFPVKLIAITEKLGEKELAWIYRPEGWNIKQIVHHCADSHMNAFIRFKLSLTENNPKIKPYHEDRWALLSDSNTSNLCSSLFILEGVHAKWSAILASMSEDDFKKTYIHPELNMHVELREALANYDWHSRHHIAHIKQALRACGVYNQ
jgi:hypothetical protein